MKQKSILRTCVLAACSLGLVAFSSCSKDDNDKNDLRLSMAKVQVAQGASATVTVSKGTPPFVAKSANDQVATAKIVKNVLTVTGVKAGRTSVTVTDKNKRAKSLPVFVAAPLSFDKGTVEVAVGKEVVVAVKSGTAPYTVMSKDSKTATATVKDAKVTIKGIKAGKTSVSVTDKNKIAGTIEVIVK